MAEKDLLKEYGVRGSMLFESWERSFRDLADKQKFSPEGEKDHAALRELKLKILQELDSSVRKDNTLKKAFWIIIAVGIGGAVTVAAIAPGATLLGMVLLWGGIIGGAATWKMRRSLEKQVGAIADFDKQYFEGELLFKRKNGISI